MPLDDIQAAAAAQFDRQSQAYGTSHILADVGDVEAAMNFLDLRPGASVLDVATGGGHCGLAFAAHGCSVTLADIAPSMLANAAALAEERGFVVKTVETPAETLPFPAGTFDVVTCRVAAHHFSDPEAFVRESARVLVPRGYFILIDGSIHGDQPEAEAWLHDVEKWRDPSHHRLLSQPRWETLVQDAGLAIVHSELQPMKQPDLEWYFTTANTPPENRDKVVAAVQSASHGVRAYMRLAEEDGKTVWWWQRLTLIARRSASSCS